MSCTPTKASLDAESQFQAATTDSRWAAKGKALHNTTVLPSSDTMFEPMRTMPCVMMHVNPQHHSEASTTTSAYSMGCKKPLQLLRVASNMSHPVTLVCPTINNKGRGRPQTQGSSTQQAAHKASVCAAKSHVTFGMTCHLVVQPDPADPCEPANTKTVCMQDAAI